jgi:hypothetical protein
MLEIDSALKGVILTRKILRKSVMISYLSRLIAIS